MEMQTNVGTSCQAVEWEEQPQKEEAHVWHPFHTDSISQMFSQGAIVGLGLHTWQTENMQEVFVNWYYETVSTLSTPFGPQPKLQLRMQLESAVSKQADWR